MKNVSVKAHKELQDKFAQLLKDWNFLTKVNEDYHRSLNGKQEECQALRDQVESLKSSFNKTLLDLRSHELANFESGRENRGLTLAMAALGENVMGAKKELLLEKFKRDPFKYKTVLNQSFDEAAEDRKDSSAARDVANEPTIPLSEVMSRSRLKREAIQRGEAMDKACMGRG